MDTKRNHLTAGDLIARLRDYPADTPVVAGSADNDAFDLPACDVYAVDTTVINGVTTIYISLDF